jgi:hypothetical protein
LSKGGGQSTGPAMMFVDLTVTQPGGAAWTNAAVDFLSVRWKDVGG